MPKSPESGGPPPNQKIEFESGPKNEDEWRASWNKVRKNNPQHTPWLIRRGRLLGIPDNELKGLAQEAMKQHVEEEWYGLAYSIMKEAEIGTQKERSEMGARAYQQHMGKGGYPASAASLASELWGEESPQYRAAQKLVQERDKEFQKEQEKAGPLMRLSRDATFDDFFVAFHEMIAEEGSGIDIEIEADMQEVFGEQLTKQIMSFLNGKDDRLKNTKLLDFFKEYGFGEAQLGEVFGIEFKKRRTRKKK